jgi:hypothetical protein
MLFAEGMFYFLALQASAQLDNFFKRDQPGASACIAPHRTGNWLASHLSRIASAEMVEIRSRQEVSPGGCDTVELRNPPVSTEDPMTDERMALVELLQKSGDSDFLRAVAEAVLQILMETDVEGLIGAGRHERSAERLILPQWIS